jgi:two-component system nitrogen regulation response regulator NtrX
MSSVLIVDDEPNIRRMVGALLASEGYEVRDAADGASGVARAAETTPDVVLLDLMMPGELDGLGTLARLRESAPDVPVIMMSGKAGLSDAVKATKLGAFNFLEKPLSPRGCCSRWRRRWSCDACGARRARSARISASRGR